MTNPAEEPDVKKVRPRSIMDRMLERLARASLYRPWATLVILASITAVSASLFTRIRVDNSLENLVDEDNEVVSTFLDEMDRFGGNAMLVAAFEAPDLLDADVLRMVDDLTERIERIPQIRVVGSITNLQLLTGDEEGLNIRPLMEEIPVPPDRVDQVRRLLATDPTIAGNFVDESLTATAIVAMFKYDKRNDLYFGEITARVREMTREYPDVDFRIAGVPVIISEINRHSLGDIYLLTLGAALMMTFALVIVFRNVTGVVLAHFVVAVSAVWTVGVMAFLDVPITMASTMLPALIMIIGVSDVIHLIFHYYEQVEKGRPKRETLVNTVREIGLPCLMTSVTTAVGFVSLTISEIIPVRQFGYVAAIGLMMTFLAAFTIVPAVLYYLPTPGREIKTRLDRRTTGRLLNVLGRTNVRFRWVMLAFGVVAVIFSVGGVMRIRVENNNFDFFKEDSALLDAVRFIDRRFAGSNSLDILFIGHGPDALVEPAALQGMADMQDRLMEFPEVRKVVSLSDLVARLNRAMHEDDPAFERIPESRQLIAQYLLLFSISGGEDLSSLVSLDYSTARTSARVVESGSFRQQEIIEEVHAYVRDHPNPHYDVVVTGGVALNASLVGHLIESQIKSFGVALGVIFLMFVLLFRSVRIAAVTLIPNVIPIGIALGLMGWLDIPLNIVTVMIASVAIGIAVDDTIHYTARCITEFRRCGDYDEAMFRVLHSVGRAIVFTSVVVTLGFAATLLSSFKPPIQFGVLAGTTMIAALFGDLVILPAFFWLFKPLGRATPRDRSEV